MVRSKSIRRDLVADSKGTLALPHEYNIPALYNFSYTDDNNGICDIQETIVQ